MAEVWAAQVMAKVCLEEGANVWFGVHGGHTMPFDDWLSFYGGKWFHMRHEQAGPYAADAYGRVKGRPAICAGTSGPGVANMMPGIAQAYTCKSPVVCFFGQHPVLSDKRWGLQEGYGIEMVKCFTKSAERIVNPSMAGFFMKKAFRDATTYPYGPAAVEIPLDVLAWSPIDTASVAGWTPNWRTGPEPRVAGDPDLVAQCVDMLLEAKNPIIVAGEGIHWAGAAPELKEFVEMTQIPVHTRRIARGAVPEDHALHVGSGYRGRFLRNADLIVVIGLRMGYLEGFGNWGGNPKFIQINEASSEICFERPSELEIIGNPKLVLRQMLEYVKSSNKLMKKRDEWLAMIETGRQQFKMKVQEQVAAVADQVPINPHVIGQEMGKFVSDVIPEGIVVFDSYTGTNYFTDKLSARFSGQILDAGEWAGVGHGIGMGIGAQVAAPGKPVLSFIGDGGIGIGGFDIETAARYDLPVVYVLYNNGVWIAGEKAFAYGENWKALGPQNFHGRDNDKGVRYRYDKVFEPLGCHVEHVEHPTEIRGALERSFNSGKTSLVNVVVTNEEHVSMFYRPDWACMFWHIPEERWGGWEEGSYKLMNDTFKSFHGRDLPKVEFDPWAKTEKK